MLKQRKIAISMTWNAIFLFLGLIFLKYMLQLLHKCYKCNNNFVTIKEEVRSCKNVF